MIINPKLINGPSNNYGSSINIPINTNYVAPSDGIVRFGGYAQAIMLLYVNNTKISTVYAGNQSTASTYNSWRVNKGDIIKIEKVSGSDGWANVHDFLPIND